MNSSDALNFQPILDAAPTVTYSNFTWVIRNLTYETIDLQLYFPQNTSTFVNIDKLKVIWDFNYDNASYPGFNQTVLVPRQEQYFVTEKIEMYFSIILIVLFIAS